MKIIAIGGEPATGKTTLMRKVIEALGPGESCKHGLLRYSVYKPETILGSPFSGLVMVLGIYDDSTFAGTDRLSMAVITDAKKFIKLFHAEDTTIIFEGDRLFNTAFIDACIEHAPTGVFCVTSEEETKEKRHQLRGDTQPEKWLRGMQTKVKNITQKYDGCEFLPNDADTDVELCAKRILVSIKRLTPQTHTNRDAVDMFA